MWFGPQILRCVECRRSWDDRHDRWRAYRTDVPGEDEEPLLAFYCPACARFAFDENPIRSWNEPLGEEG